MSGIGEIEDAMHRGSKQYGEEDEETDGAENSILLAPPPPLR